MTTAAIPDINYVHGKDFSRSEQRRKIVVTNINNVGFCSFAHDYDGRGKS